MSQGWVRSLAAPAAAAGHLKELVDGAREESFHDANEGICGDMRGWRAFLFMMRGFSQRERET